MTMKRNDDAVSPVIGVILMVAITVILAAIIAAFVFGMVGGTSTTKVVGLTVAQDNETHGSITWQGGADIRDIQSWNITSPEQTTYPNDIPTVGLVSPIEMEPGDRVVITASFKDGSTQVIYDRQF
ncbi:type IV pilin [Methanocalculus chunghsingensis]|uniref:type IV pilin n=1 Tax=Methanocalculus chunghsingensis TaxID=156457 RepID=UPI001FEA99C8|nr:type IV pilin N-terminal domain-containing protein [Methanocalculus chunghsingensis]